MKENQTMFLITFKGDDLKYFGLIPINDKSPYVEAFYIPESRSFIIIGKNKKSKFHMVEKLNSEGLPVPSKVTPDGKKKERVLVDSYSEYYITNPDEIIEFLEMTCVNFKDKKEFVESVVYKKDSEKSNE